MAKPLHASLRFLVAGLFLILLTYIMWKLSRWRSIEYEAVMSFLEGTAATVVLVLMLPILLRGGGWQRAIAAFLVVIPVLGLSHALIKGIEYVIYDVA